MFLNVDSCSTRASARASGTPSRPASATMTGPNEKPAPLTISISLLSLVSVLALPQPPIYRPRGQRQADDHLAADSADSCSSAWRVPTSSNNQGTLRYK